MLKIKDKYLLFTLVILQCLLTVVHHLYGEFFLYKDGQRLHIAIFAPFALLLTFAPLWLHRNSFGWRMFMFWSGLIWVAIIGLFEGFWNHLIVDLVALLNLTDELAFAFIRPLPGDIIFEVTGIAQFFVACGLMYFLYRAYRQTLFKKV